MDKDFENGWTVASSMVGATSRNHLDVGYVQNIQKEIDNLYNNLMDLKAPTLDNKVNGGNMAEAWHAGTFDINSAVEESKHRATRLGSNDYASVDIDTNFGKQYSSKFYATAKDTENAQASLNRNTSQPQDSLVPIDQLDEVKNKAHKKSLTDARPEMREAHARVEKTATGTLKDGEGVESTPLTKKGSTDLSREVNEDKLDLEKRGITTQDQITMTKILNRSIKTGFLSAGITAALATAPDICEMITKYIKSGEISIENIKNTGTKGVKSAGDGFIKGTLASYFVLMCQSGKFGLDFKAANPSMVSMLVVLTFETIKDSILLARGEISARQMGGRFVDNSIQSLAFIGAMQLGGAIGQSIAPELPFIGYLIGSLIGVTCCVLYQIGKRKLISFCKDSGFTCFGLVEQDYALPDEALRDMGVDLARIQTAKIERANIQYANVKTASSNEIGYKMIRRGVFSLNKIGYTYG